MVFIAIVQLLLCRALNKYFKLMIFQLNHPMNADLQILAGIYVKGMNQIGCV